MKPQVASAGSGFGAARHAQGRFGSASSFVVEVSCGKTFGA